MINAFKPIVSCEPFFAGIGTVFAECEVDGFIVLGFKESLKPNYVVVNVTEIFLGFCGC